MKLYDVGNRDVEKLGQLYCDHVSAMTGEKLHSKADIAAELAWRDQKLQAAEEEVASKERQMVALLGQICELQSLLYKEMIMNKWEEWKAQALEEMDIKGWRRVSKITVRGLIKAAEEDIAKYEKTTMYWMDQFGLIKKNNSELREEITRLREVIESTPTQDPECRGGCCQASTLRMEITRLQEELKKAYSHALNAIKENSDGR